ncbi:MAG: NlpC/P60 family protein [Peptococcaceae bacterium]|nr:NlpC/P60 family protein [Peptococcaceae bacterium]
MKQKSIAAILLIALGISSLGAVPAFADDTAAVEAATEQTSALQGATSDYHIDNYQLSASVINEEGTLYLPLRSTLEVLGASVTTNPDKQERKLKLTTSSGDTQLYYNEAGTAISTAANGNYYNIKVINNTTYAPMAFIQELTNRVVSVHDNNLMLIKVDDSAIWKTLEAYSIDAAYIKKSIGEQIVETAMKYIGVPYVWGGTSPSGFDCSGLVQYVYAENGISIPRVTYTQQAAATPVSFSDLQPGDLVFWGGSAYHVGIYIGDGKYIHSPAPGQSVCIQSYSAYPFTSAGRIV